MLKVLLIIAFVSMLKMFGLLIKLCYYRIFGTKYKAVIGEVLNTERNFRGRKNTTKYTFAVSFEDEEGRYISEISHIEKDDTDEGYANGDSIEVLWNSKNNSCTDYTSLKKELRDQSFVFGCSVLVSMVLMVLITYLDK